MIQINKKNQQDIGAIDKVGVLIDIYRGNVDIGVGQCRVYLQTCVFFV